MRKRWFIIFILIWCCKNSSDKGSLEQVQPWTRIIKEFYESGNIKREYYYKNGKIDSMETVYYPSGQIERETFRFWNKLCNDEFTFYDSTDLDVKWPVKKYVYYNCMNKGKPFIRKYTKDGKIWESEGSPIGFLLNKSYFKGDTMVLLIGLGLAAPPRHSEKLIINVKLQDGTILFSDESSIDETPELCNYWIETTVSKEKKDFFVEVIYSLNEYNQSVSNSDTCYFKPKILAKGGYEFLLCD